MNKNNNGYPESPFRVMMMEVEREKKQSLLPTKHYKICVDTDSYFYGANEFENITVSVTKLTIETGSIIEENSVSTLPVLLPFMEESFPNLYLKNAEMKNQKLILVYEAGVMNSYYSMDELFSNELEVAHQPLQKLITENLLTDVKLTVQIETN